MPQRDLVNPIADLLDAAIRQLLDDLLKFADGKLAAFRAASS